MDNDNSPVTPNSSTERLPELNVVEIESRPGPDGEERLRRLFTLLVKIVLDHEATSLRS